MHSNHYVGLGTSRAPSPTTLFHLKEYVIPSLDNRKRNDREIIRTTRKLRVLLPPLTRSPSLPEGGKACADFAVSASESNRIYNFV